MKRNSFIWGCAFRGVDVLYIYSHARWSLCCLCLLAHQAEFMRLVVTPMTGAYVACIIDSHAMPRLVYLACTFMWRVFTRMSRGVYVACIQPTRMPAGIYVVCIYSHAWLSLCGLYIAYSQARLSLCGRYLLPSQVVFMWPIFTRIPDAATVGDSGLCCLYSYPCDVCGALSLFLSV